MFLICSQAEIAKSMIEPAQTAPDDGLESDVDAAIALCDGDVRAALRAAFVYIQFLERQIEIISPMVSAGYIRGKISAPRAASKKLDDWRDIFRRTSGNDS
jgi:hypothetical protein